MPWKAGIRIQAVTAPLAVCAIGGGVAFAANDVPTGSPGPRVITHSQTQIQRIKIPLSDLPPASTHQSDVVPFDQQVPYGWCDAAVMADYPLDGDFYFVTVCNPGVSAITDWAEVYQLNLLGQPTFIDSAYGFCAVCDQNDAFHNALTDGNEFTSGLSYEVSGANYIPDAVPQTASAVFTWVEP